jgi:CubicO group peptidase (beta-lactamase class C family)
MRALRRLALALIAAVPLVTVAPEASAQGAAAPPPDFDAYVAKVLSTFQVPGVAVAIVKDGKVVLAKGYGVRTLGKPDRVDSLTRFGIASNTKAFTATALAILVERGKLKWDAPVRTYLPDFAMYDPFVTREITVRDLLVHRSGLGLGAGDLLWWPASTYTRAEIAQRLRYIKPATSFRSAYAYDNVLYLVAGQLIEKLSGKSWEDFIKAELLEPLGMSHSTVRHADAASGGNVATTHAEVDGKVVPVPPMTSDNTNPAGGINAGAADIARWMITQLDSGRTPEGKRLWSPGSARELWTGVTPMPIGGANPALAPLRASFNLYALGFGVRDYRGQKMLSHTGGLPGYVSEILMLPDQRVGVAVFTNQESSAAFRSITLAVLDHYLGVQPAWDWLGGYRTLDAQAHAALATETVKETARDTTVRPTLPLARYAATYQDVWYGDVAVALKDGRLTMTFSHTPELTGVLEHQKGDAFIVRWRDRSLRADAVVTFEVKEGRVTRVKMIPTPGVDFSFDFQDLDLRPKGARVK